MFLKRIILLDGSLQLCTKVWYGGAWFRYKGDCFGMNGLLESHWWPLALSAELIWLVEEYDADLVRPTGGNAC